MIRIRTDDVMVNSTQYPHDRAVNRIQQIHRWISQQPKTLIHIPTILVTEIQGYPEVIPFIKEETEKGTMTPQLHGYEHVNYADLSLSEIEEHLDKSMQWFRRELGIEPTIWATPWGGRNETMVEAASKFYLQVETTEDTILPGRAIQLLKKVNKLKGQTILGHWWERGLKILRIVEIMKYGGYDEAREARMDLF